MHVLALVLGLAIIAVALFFAPWPWRLLEFGLRRYQRLAPGRFRPLVRFLEHKPLREDVEFWIASGRSRGILVRLADTTAIVHELQRRVECGGIDIDDAEEVLRMALAHRWVSLVALAEAVFCRAIPALPHTTARLALQIHWQLTLRAVNLCRDANDDFAGGLLL